jgi:hypothetical protein
LLKQKEIWMKDNKKKRAPRSEEHVFETDEEVETEDRRPPRQQQRPSTTQKSKVSHASADVRDSLAQVERIKDMIEDEVSDEAKDRASDFFEDVLEHVTSVGETIERLGAVTERQRRALDNWEDGVGRWIH